MDNTIAPPVTARGAASAQNPHCTGAMVLALLALYIALGSFSSLFTARFGAAPFHPEAAVVMALLMFGGLRFAPLVLLAALFEQMMLPGATPPLAPLLIGSVILTAGYAAMAYLLVGRFRIRIELETRQDVLRLLGVTLACMLLCGAAYVGVQVLFGISPAERYFAGLRRFTVDYSAGILVAAPLLFMFFAETRRKQLIAFLRLPEAWAQVATVQACMWGGILLDQEDYVSNFYVLLIPLIWTATRFGVTGVVSILVLIQTSVVLAEYLNGYHPLSVFNLQLLLITLAITGLLLGVTIDEERRTRADFRESLKLAAAGEMAAAITHEINQPLTAMSGYAKALQLIVASPQPDRAQLNDMLRKLVEESSRTADVVRRLRDFFRSGSTQLETISMTAIAERVVTSLCEKAQAMNITLTCHASGEVPPVLVDPLQIEVVLRNLVMNAIDSATQTDRSRGSVEVTIAVNPSGEVQVAVQDSGPGIRASEVDRLFESFVTTKTSGMGMGLSISRAIVDAHGGRIWAVSGATGLLCFTLPLDEAPSRA
jgi:signal transduction histidine kinase